MTQMHFDAATHEARIPRDPRGIAELRERLEYLPAAMRQARRWLLWKPGKVPYYVSGDPRGDEHKRPGYLDSPHDVAQLATLADALGRLEADSRFAGLGFALGFDAAIGAHWQGLDLDKALDPAGQFTTERARKLYEATEGYAEVSPSGAGLHVIGIGAAFRTIKWTKVPEGEQKIEMYSGARFFTVTGRMMREGDPADLAPLAERVRAALVASGRQREHKAREHVNGAAAYLDRMPENLQIWVKAHPIEAALAEHGYQRIGGRWLSPRSESGVPGVVVLDELRAVTFHASDAGIGTEVASDGEVFNAFDAAVRYIFGGDRNRAMRETLPRAGQEAPGAAQTGAEDAEHQRDEGSATEPAEEPQNLFREAVAPRLDPADVPAPIRRMAEAFSAATGFDVSGALMAATVAAAAAIDDRYRLAVRPGSDWFESARLWAVLIGTPSAGKSPTIRAGTDPIKDLHSELFAKWFAANESADDKDQEPKPALFTSDATTEALADRLRDNPRGILMLTEEFASWIGSIDAYRDGAGARNRGEWLQLYDGGPHQVDRVKRGSFLVPNWGASVLAACTPAGLRDQVRKLPDDGLIHRFMPCIMAAPIEPGRESARDALRDWSVRLRELFAATTCEKPTARVRISTSAQIDFDREAGEIRRAIDAVYDLSPALASHIGKHPGMLARVALTFHLADGRAGDAIEADTMQMAARFLRTVRRHAAAMFLGILATAPALEIARSVARSLVADASRPTSIGRAYMTHRCRAFRQAQDFERRLAVQVLEDGHWLYPVPDSRAYGGWGASAWAINQRVYDLFAGEGDAHRDRRQVVRDFIREGGDA